MLVRDEGDNLANLSSRLNDDCPRAFIIAFADRIDVSRILVAGRWGVSDYLVGNFSADDIVQCLTRLAGQEPGKLPIEQRREKARHLISELTSREREILRSVADGLRSSEIGEALSISRRTVERHRANILDKLGVRRTSEALRLVFDASLHETLD